MKKKSEQEKWIEELGGGCIMPTVYNHKRIHEEMSSSDHTCRIMQ